MDKSIDFASRASAPYVITSVVARDSLIPALKMYDIYCSKPGTTRRLAIHSKDGDAPAVGYQLVHKRLPGGFAAMWSNQPKNGDGHIMGGGFTIRCIPETWLEGAAS